MTHYSEYDEYNLNDLKVGDTFDTCDRYTVAYVLPYERYFVDGFYTRPEDRDNIIVVQGTYIDPKDKETKTYYQVMASGDWEGCEPWGATIQECLARSLCRVNQIDEQ